MPTENKPAPFSREDRYIVLKLKRLPKEEAEYLRDCQPKALVECVVVERDWPEYQLVWAMIEHRMAGYPVPDFNLWRRADELQTEVLKLRALLAAPEAPAPADAQPVGCRYRRSEVDVNYRAWTYREGVASDYGPEWEVEPLYTHPDAGDVGRMKCEVSKWRGTAGRLTYERDTLRAQLAYAVDALNEVVKVSAMHEKPFEIATLAIGELSASAEQEVKP